MMRAWLDIDGSPGAPGESLSLTPAQGAPATGARSLPLLLGLDAIERPLSIPGIAAAAASNMSVRLANPGGQLGQLWGQRPPLRRAARVMTDSGPVFEGTVTGLRLGREITLDLEAGMDRPLSDRLPLRTSAVWGGWRDVRTLPWGWGRVTLTPIQYSDDQRVFLLLDHPIAGVDEVRRDDAPVTAWAWRNGLDSTGRAVSFLELAEPLAAGERLAVRLRGRLHPGTGELLQSPAQIVHDLLANLAGLPVQWADLDDWRAETEGVTLGGLLDSGDISIRAAVDAVVQSAGGAWSSAMPGVAMTWPPLPDEAAPAAGVHPLSAHQLQASASAGGLYTVLRVLYDWDYAAGRYGRAIQLQAPEALAEHGRLELEWPAPWLRSPRHAQALGQRMLAWLARPRWRVSWQSAFADAPTGAWVEMRHPLSPVQGRHRLLHATLDLASASLSCAIEAAVGEPPLIETTRLSEAYAPLVQAGLSVEVADSEIIFTARDEQGQPLAGARVTLDGQTQRVADAAGRVSFPVQRGRHVLWVQADGYPDTETVVVI